MVLLKLIFYFYKRVVDKYFCHFLTFSLCCMYEIQVLNFEKWVILCIHVLMFSHSLLTSVTRESHQFSKSYSIEVLTDKFLSCHFDTLDVTHTSLQVICKLKWFFMQANNDVQHLTSGRVVIKAKSTCIDVKGWVTWFSLFTSCGSCVNHILGICQLSKDFRGKVDFDE